RSSDLLDLPGEARVLVVRPQVLIDERLPGIGLGLEPRRQSHCDHRQGANRARIHLLYELSHAEGWETAMAQRVVSTTRSGLAGGSACPTRTQALSHQSGTDAFVCQPGDLSDSFT